MKKNILLLGTIFLLPGMASADILMKWERKPIPIELQV